MSVMKLLGKFGGVLSIQSLRVWNIGLAAVYAVQAIIILALSGDKTYPISTSYQTVDTLQTSVAGNPVLAPASKYLFDLNMVYLVAGILLLAAAAHASVAIWYRARYERDIANGFNRIRWFEYAVTTGLIFVCTAVISGVYDVATLGLLLVIGAVVSLLNLVIETHNPPRVRGNKVRWGVFAVATLAGAAAWLVICGALLASNVFGAGQLPAYVFLVAGAMFLAFVAMTAIMVLQLKKIGLWKQYVQTERSFMLLSLVAKTALAWLIFASVLKK